MGNAVSFSISWEEDVKQRLAFEVLGFEGREAISELYEFRVKLRAKNSLTDNPLGKKATLFISMEGYIDGDTWQDQVSNYNGIVIEFKELGKSGVVEDYFYYEATLMPKLAKLKYTQKSDVFVEAGLEEILTTVLTAHSIVATDYQILLSQNKYNPSEGYYNRYSYVCQYEESDWDFLSRLLERDGVYYYFEQKDTQEICVITDTNNTAINNNNPIHFGFATADNQKADANAIEYIESKSKLLPQQIIIKNFGYEKAHLGVNGDGVIDCTAFVSSDGKQDNSLFGELVIYGEHFVNPDSNEDGDFLATIRAQEQFCQAKVYTARSTLVPISAGMTIILKSDNPKLDGKYLVTEVVHKCEPEYGSLGIGMIYSNTLSLIPANVQYRPLRKTPWPRIYGTMNALIDGETSIDGADYPQIDGTGRYKIRLPFLKNSKGQGKDSIWVRLATPYAGKSFGMHFPLHTGTEVVLSFRDGNPDLPVIMSAVFNSEHLNVVIDRNSYMGGVILTKANNAVILNDTENKHSIRLATNNNYKDIQ